jgi:hypothetical protein
VAALATCSFVAFFGWILMRGSSELEPSGAANRAAAPACEPASCAARWAPAYRPLPRDWGWPGRTYEFEQMFREEPGPPRVAAFQAAYREERGTLR